MDFIQEKQEHIPQKIEDKKNCISQRDLERCMNTDSGSELKSSLKDIDLLASFKEYESNEADFLVLLNKKTSFDSNNILQLAVVYSKKTDIIAFIDFLYSIIGGKELSNFICYKNKEGSNLFHEMVLYSKHKELIEFIEKYFNKLPSLQVSLAEKTKTESNIAMLMAANATIENFFLCIDKIKAKFGLDVVKYLLTKTDTEHQNIISYASNSGNDLTLFLKFISNIFNRSKLKEMLQHEGVLTSMGYGSGNTNMMELIEELKNIFSSDELGDMFVAAYRKTESCINKIHIANVVAHSKNTDMTKFIAWLATFFEPNNLKYLVKSNNNPSNTSLLAETIIYSKKTDIRLFIKELTKHMSIVDLNLMQPNMCHSSSLNILQLTACYSEVTHIELFIQQMTGYLGRPAMKELIMQATAPEGGTMHYLVYSGSFVKRTMRTLSWLEEMKKFLNKEEWEKLVLQKNQRGMNILHLICYKGDTNVLTLLSDLQDFFGEELMKKLLIEVTTKNTPVLQIILSHVPRLHPPVVLESVREMLNDDDEFKKMLMYCEDHGDTQKQNIVHRIMNDALCSYAITEFFIWLKIFDVQLMKELAIQPDSNQNSIFFNMVQYPETRSIFINKMPALIGNDEIKKIIMKLNNCQRTFFHWSAHYSDKIDYAKLITDIETVLSKDEIKTLMMQLDQDGNNFLHIIILYMKAPKNLPLLFEKMAYYLNTEEQKDFFTKPNKGNVFDWMDIFLNPVNKAYCIDLIYYYFKIKR